MPPTILERWSLSPDELTEIVDLNPSLRGMLVGYIAESKLRQLFARSGRVSALAKDDDHDRRKKGDLVFTYRDHQFRIESKSLQTTMTRRLEGGRFEGAAQCDASDRRVVRLARGRKIETTCLLVGEFDILAVCLFDFTGRWDFCFALNRDLPRSAYKKYPPAVRAQLIKSLVPVTLPLSAPFVDEPFGLLDRLVAERERSRR
jgi:hypothetical protein